jgi:protein-tyrosine phosphatase
MTSTVLFVCTGNYYRSRYAEILFNATRPAELDWIAESRGFTPSAINPGPIAQATVARLREHGIDSPTFSRMPLRLFEQDLRSATRVIALDEREHRGYVEDLFPDWRTTFEFWNVADLDFIKADEALSRIDTDVANLIAALHNHAR